MTTTPQAVQERDEQQPVPHSWSESRRFLPTTFVRPAQRFMRREASAGVVMLAAAVAAVVLANSPFAAAYETFWETDVEFAVGPLHWFDGLSLRDWVNDGAMAMFFFVVVLEIKRELVAGELRNPRAAALPVVAALGGMVAPALLYVAFTAGTTGASGWGIPMATDIAFAAGIVSLAGTRVPSAAKVFLLSLAIVDDLGAIVVIAVFYSHGGAVEWLGIALLAVASAVVLRRVHVRSVLPYVLLGILCWVALHEAGVHPTLAGVLFALLTPSWSFYDPGQFGVRARALVHDIERSFDDRVFDQHEYEQSQTSLQDLVRLSRETEAPLDRLEHQIAPWVSFLVVPTFAFANAGLPLAGAWDAAGQVGQQVALGVATGLLVGKVVGIVAAAWLACRLGVAELPTGATWRTVFALAACAGIGFTVSLFVSDLAFADPDLVAAAKLGVFAGSLVSGVLGYALLRSLPLPATGSEMSAAGPEPR